MRKNFILLAVIFSVVLNIGFIGAYCLQKAGLHPLRLVPANHKRFLYQELNLSPEQLAEFEPGRDRFHTYLALQSRKIQAGQVELIDLLSENPPDRKAINARHEEIQALQQQMQTRVIDHFLKESRILTPEQRKKFFALIKRRIKKNSGFCPGWMQQSRVKPAHGESR
ncbi:MAG TPA: periplasmic heavy metal sensor [Desulfobulbus sp.]|nr:periplasmic heavy metal sensor [Desulfobulbus sp.]